MADNSITRNQSPEAKRPMSEMVERAAKWRKNLQDIGGYDNELVSVPAGGVREIIADLETAAQEIEELRRLQSAVNVLCRAYTRDDDRFLAVDVGQGPHFMTGITTSDLISAWRTAREILRMTSDPTLQEKTG